MGFFSFYTGKNKIKVVNKHQIRSIKEQPYGREREREKKKAEISSYFCVSGKKPRFLRISVLT